jgi:hypothetical protein
MRIKVKKRPFSCFLEKIDEKISHAPEHGLVLDFAFVLFGSLAMA